MAIGLSYDRFRKSWRDLVRDTGFPAPFLGTRWDAAAIDAWKRARSGRGLPTAQRTAQPVQQTRLRAQLDDLRRA